MCFCSLLTCTEDKGPPKRPESASEEPMLQKEAARIWQCPQIKAILHLGYKNMHPNWAPLCWHGFPLYSRDVMPTDRGSTAWVSGCHHLTQQPQNLSSACWTQTQSSCMWASEVHKEKGHPPQRRNKSSSVTIDITECTRSSQNQCAGASSPSVKATPKSRLNCSKPAPSASSESPPHHHLLDPLHAVQTHLYPAPGLLPRPRARMVTCRSSYIGCRVHLGYAEPSPSL